MEQEYRVIRLQQNRLYPTYQLHAYMANKKTATKDGLRLAGLIVMDWLRQRLGDHVPKEIQLLPTPEAYRTLSDDCLPSIHIDSGFVMDVLFLPNAGVWSMQLTEPDLGSDPGNPTQARQAVPGRVIQTNIGFRISGTQLECGFQTVISDPEGTQEEAEVYRLSVIRRLVDHPDFGLKQVTMLGYQASHIQTMDQLRNLKAVWRNDGNQLPCVIFTYFCTEKQPQQRQIELPTFDPGKFLPSYLYQHTLEQQITQTPPSSDEVMLPYDVSTFAKYGLSFCRTYTLDHSLFVRAMSLLQCNAKPGDILILEPVAFGGLCRILPFQNDLQIQTEIMVQLRNAMYTYPRGKIIDFGRIVFLSAAREGLLHWTKEAMNQAESVSLEWTQKLALLDSQWKSEFKKQDDAYHALLDQLARQKHYQERLEQEKDQLIEDHRLEMDRIKSKLAEKNDEISYLRRKLRQPKDHKEIAEWVEQEFEGKLVLHPRAVSLLENKAASQISCALICDALDFLAMDYWSERYERLSREEMLKRCSEKYGRPFEIKPTGKTTMEAFPNEYKISYCVDEKGNYVKRSLDYHLRVGNDPENLLRIYFLHDDKKRQIVVGSLPRHLRAVTIK